MSTAASHPITQTAFPRDARVYIVVKGEECHGVVTRVGRNGKIHVQCDDGSTWTCGYGAIKPSNKPAPVKERVVNPFAKGDRIETDDKKRGVLYGLVASVRDEKITMDVDGGNATVRGHFKFFRMSKQPLIVQTDAPSPFDIYGVIKYKETPVTDAWEGHEGNGYSCIITKNGKPTLEVYNEGVGGCSSVSVLKGIPGKEEDEFYEALKKFYVHVGGRECDYTGDVLDIWTEWYVHKKQWTPFAKEAKEMTDLCKKYEKEGE